MLTLSVFAASKEQEIQKRVAEIERLKAKMVERCVRFEREQRKINGRRKFGTKREREESTIAEERGENVTGDADGE